MTGLTNEQVQQRIEEGKVNANENPNTRSYKQIVRENVLTFFNFLNLALMVMVLLVGSYKNSMFMGIIVINTVIGIIQEVRAKKTLDKLAILTESKAVVLREGKKWTISTEKLVLDDILFLKTGDQVPADAKVLEGSIEVNESLLTGESDNLQKIEGDELFSGSFVTSGEACCQVIHVGKDNYASQITSEAKEFKRHNSELRNSLNAILKTISVIIVPMGLLLFYKQYYVAGNGIRDAVVNMVAAVLGMIPEGLVLLTSVALTLGALALTRKNTLVQELFVLKLWQEWIPFAWIRRVRSPQEPCVWSKCSSWCMWKGWRGKLRHREMRMQPGRLMRQIYLDAEGKPDAGCQPELAAAGSRITSEEAPQSGTALQAVETPQPEMTMNEIERVMANMMSVLKDKNATADALHKRFSKKNGHDRRPLHPVLI